MIFDKSFTAPSLIKYLLVKQNPPCFRMGLEWFREYIHWFLCLYAILKYKPLKTKTLLKTYTILLVNKFTEVLLILSWNIDPKLSAAEWKSWWTILIFYVRGVNNWQQERVSLSCLLPSLSAKRKSLPCFYPRLLSAALPPLHLPNKMRSSIEPHNYQINSKDKEN